MVQTPSQKFIRILGSHLRQTSQILSPENPRLMYGLQVYPLLRQTFFFLRYLFSVAFQILSFCLEYLCLTKITFPLFESEIAL